MKNIIVLMLVLIACSANTKENPEPPSSSDYIKLIQVDGGCKLYRILDNHNLVYWSVCETTIAGSGYPSYNSSITR